MSRSSGGSHGKFSYADVEKVLQVVIELPRSVVITSRRLMLLTRSWPVYMHVRCTAVFPPMRLRRCVCADAFTPMRLRRCVCADAFTPMRLRRCVCADAFTPMRLRRCVCTDAFKPMRLRRCVYVNAFAYMRLRRTG
ncbi:unnamed protein product [Spodoptera exigua]|nr:unnamed protein product [Spodoptera exigua]